MSLKFCHVDGGVVGVFTATVTHFGAVRLQENRIQIGVSQRVRSLKTKRNLRNQLFVLWTNYYAITTILYVFPLVVANACIIPI